MNDFDVALNTVIPAKKPCYNGREWCIKRGGRGMEPTVLNQRYELKQRIGEGGMATVYEGVDLRLNRRVALKVLHRHYVHDPDFLARFRHEAQAAAILSHPNIVNVYDVDQDGDYHYIVMEYVDGVNLKTLINRHSRLLVATATGLSPVKGSRPVSISYRVTPRA